MLGIVGSGIVGEVCVGSPLTSGGCWGSRAQAVSVRVGLKSTYRWDVGSWIDGVNSGLFSLVLALF